MGAYWFRAGSWQPVPWWELLRRRLWPYRPATVETLCEVALVMVDRGEYRLLSESLSPGHARRVCDGLRLSHDEVAADGMLADLRAKVCA